MLLTLTYLRHYPTFSNLGTIVFVKKRYTIKTQLLGSAESKMIYGITSSKDKIHDFKMFKDSETLISSKIKILDNSGYQGIKTFTLIAVPQSKKEKN